MNLRRMTAGTAARLALPAALLALLEASPAPAAFTHRIHQVQGSGSSSPLVGQSVIVEGVVTARRANAFLLQSADAEVDADPATSEGVVVFTSSAPPAAALVGNRVQVAGTVTEFISGADPGSAPLTELTSPTVVLLSTGNALPAPIAITTTEAGPGAALGALERLEAMRVSVASLTVVAPTQGTVSESNATSTSTGIFFGVLGGVDRPFREPGVVLPDALPSGAPCCVPRFDGNPERLKVDSDGQVGVAALAVATGAVVTGLTGVLDYTPRAYTLLPDGPPATVTPGVAAAVAVRPAGADEFTLGELNAQRFFDTVDDGGTSDVALTSAAYQLRLGKLSAALRDVLRSPDIIGLVEIEKLTVLQDIAARVNTDAVAAGQPNPGYQPFLVEGLDPAGIDIGFLVKTARVTVVSVTQLGLAATYINPDTGVPATLFERPPLLLRVSIPPPVGPSFPVSVLLVHLVSSNGINDTISGNRVRTKRRAQAEFVANLLQARQVANPAELIAVTGDFNAWPFNDGYVDLVGTIRGVPAPATQVVLASADLVMPDFTNLVDNVAATKRYDYLLDGNAQQLDQVLVNANLLPFFRGLEMARLGADFPETFRALAGRPERLTDHDAPVAYFNFSATAATPPGAGLTPALAAPRPWPNPARGACRVDFALPEAGDVSLDLYDVAGRRVARLARGRLGAGNHSVAWAGRDDAGRRLSAGHYFLRLEAGGRVARGQLVVVE